VEREPGNEVASVTSTRALSAKRTIISGLPQVEKKYLHGQGKVRKFLDLGKIHLIF